MNFGKYLAGDFRVFSLNLKMDVSGVVYHFYQFNETERDDVAGETWVLDGGEVSLKLFSSHE